MLAEAVSKFLVRHMGELYLPLSFGWLCIVPLTLATLFAYFFLRAWQSAGPGVLIGVGTAVWASVSWLAVPYVGGYPNLPSLTLLWLARSGPVDTWGKELFVHGVNFVLWPLAGWLAFRAKARLLDLLRGGRSGTRTGT